jgi:hypothetical protein
VYAAPEPEYLENLGLTDQISSWNEFAESAAIEMRGGPKREAGHAVQSARK